MLKRKLAETGEGKEEGEASKTEETVKTAASNGHGESDDSSNCSAGSTDALAAPEVSKCGPSPPKRMKKKVNFKGVTVYYFSRRQGFTCVPSEGGSTLGMMEKHSFQKDFSLTDFTKEQKRIHRAILAEQRRQGKMFPSPLLCSSPPAMQSSDNGGDDDVSSGSESDSEYDDYYFLQPLPIRQRRVLLRTSGVKKIDNEEKDECRDIRMSRNVCGCDCKVFCDPATCSCSVAGIQCQVDRLSFPCGCTKDGCGNPSGRIEFNPIRVRTHFIHTLMRLELERKDSESMESGPSSRGLFPGECSEPIDVVGTASVEDTEVQSMPPHCDDAQSTGSQNGDATPSSSSHNSDVAQSSPSHGDSAQSSQSSSPTSDAQSSPSHSGGPVQLKSRLKSKTEEPIDLNLFNSNEKGSCRDCQNTDMCNVMMHDVKFSMVSQQRQQQQQQHQQQQRVISAVSAAPASYVGGPRPTVPSHHHLGISLLHPPPPAPTGPLQASPTQDQHMLLFNDGEEEVYTAENTTSMYFDNDDSSYSELSESTSTEDQRPFAGLGHTPSHSGPPSMFHNNGIQTNLQNGNSLPLQSSLLNLSCTRTVADNSGMSPACSPYAPNQLTHLPPPSMYPRPTPLTSAPQNNAAAMTSPLHSTTPHHPNPHHSTTPLHSAPGMPLPIGSLDGMSAYPSPLVHNFHHPHLKFPESNPYNTNKSSQSCFASTTPSNTTASYLPPAHTDSFTTMTSQTNPSSSVTSQPASNPTATLSSCWPAPLASPTLRECFGLSSPPLAHTTTATTTTDQAVDCRVDNSCISTSNPCQGVKGNTIYAQMTTTTRDQLAAQCPGISSHMEAGQQARPVEVQPVYTDFELLPTNASNDGLAYGSFHSPVAGYDSNVADTNSGQYGQATSSTGLTGPLSTTEMTRASVAAANAESTPSTSGHISNVETICDLSTTTTNTVSNNVTSEADCPSMDTSEPTQSSQSSENECERDIGTKSTSEVCNGENASTVHMCNRENEVSNSDANFSASACNGENVALQEVCNGENAADNSEVSSTAQMCNGENEDIKSESMALDKLSSDELDQSKVSLAPCSDAKLLIVSEEADQSKTALAPCGDAKISSVNEKLDEENPLAPCGDAKLSSAGDKLDQSKDSLAPCGDAKVCSGSEKLNQSDALAQCSGAKLSCEEFDQRNSLEIPSSLPSSANQSSTSSSSSSPTGEEEKERSVDQNFEEIIKEPIVEMVLV